MVCALFFPVSSRPENDGFPRRTVWRRPAAVNPTGALRLIVEH